MRATPAFRVVLTGGIASGKSVVADEFAALGVPVLDTDQISRDVQARGSPTLAKIVTEFGSNVLDSAGNLDRRKLRERVFDHPPERKKLEAITHPAIRDELARRSNDATGAYQIHVIPLYVETGRRGNYDRVLVVDCPEELQLQRLVKRDHMQRTAAEKILSAQVSRTERLKAATDIIANEGDLTVVREQVRRLHNQFLQLAPKEQS